MNNLRKQRVRNASRFLVWFASISILIIWADAIFRGDFLFALMCSLVLGTIGVLWHYGPKLEPPTAHEDSAMSTPALGPCAFCGTENARVETRQIDGLGKQYAVRCLTCYATGPSTRIEGRAATMWLWKDALMRAIEAQDNSAISDALEGYRVLAIYHHFNGGCQFGTTHDVWNCPDTICLVATQNLFRLIPDHLPDTRHAAPAEVEAERGEEARR